MIDPQQLLFDIIEDPAGFELIDLHEDENMQVRSLVTSTRDSDITQLPSGDTKCYQPTQQNKQHRVIWKVATPFIWLIPKKQVYAGETYDFSLHGYVHNGFCISDEKNQRVSPIALRSRRPDLSEFFSIPALQNLFDMSPNLGLRFGPDKFLQARERAWISFRLRTEHRLNDHVRAFAFAGECCYKLLRIVDLKPSAHIDETPWFLHRDIIDGIGVLISDIDSSLSHEKFDEQGERYRIIAQVTRGWLAERRTMKIIRRMDPAQADMASAALVQMFTDALTRDLDKSILENMK